MINFPVSSYDSLSVPVQAPVVVRVPVETQEVNNYLSRLKSALGMTDIDDYNVRLVELLEIAMSAVEQYTRLSLQPQRVTVTYAQYAGEPLPFGPVWNDPVPVVNTFYPDATITMTDETGSKVIGGAYPYLDSFKAGSVSYTSGFSNAESGALFPIPGGLTGAIIEHAAASFRAGAVSGIAPNTYWKTLAAPFRRFD